MTVATVRLLAADPALGSALSESARRDADRQASARVVHFDCGILDLPTDPAPFSGWYGLLVLDGALFRHVELLQQAWPELLGPGDLVRPWTNATEQLASIPAHGRYEVLQPVRVALLDRDFALRMSAWPEIAATLLDRAVERSRSLVYHLAATQPSHVEQRVWIVLWHLADRWGRMTPSGVELQVPSLSNRVLASMLGARRPTVSLAVRRLSARGLLSYRPREGWTLHGAPEAFAGVRRGHPAAR